jgi:hypothetical protein
MNERGINELRNSWLMPAGICQLNSFRGSPTPGYKIGTEDNRPNDDYEGKNKGEPSAAQDTWALVEEAGALHFILGRLPGHVV